ncbi:MAG: hypothetical protein SFU56_01880 [Capsulimonadales bacterium]|nr:hypothetical protein [Capsulimonadales bacterium]
MIRTDVDPVLPKRSPSRNEEMIENAVAHPPGVGTSKSVRTGDRASGREERILYLDLHARELPY